MSDTLKQAGFCNLILFYLILFYFILFYFILFYFILFYFILFYLFYFILFYFILFYSEIDPGAWAHLIHLMSLKFLEIVLDYSDPDSLVKII